MESKIAIQKTCVANFSLSLWDYRQNVRKQPEAMRRLAIGS